MSADVQFFAQKQMKTKKKGHQQQPVYFHASESPRC